MLCVSAMTVVVLNDLVHQRSKSHIRIRAASVHTHARVQILASCENAMFEGETNVVSLVVQLLPNLLSQVLGQQTLGAIREQGHLVAQVQVAVQVGADQDSTGCLWKLNLQIQQRKRTQRLDCSLL